MVRLRFVETGSIKVDKNGFGTAQNDIFWFNISMDGIHRVQGPEGPANLCYDPSRLLGREERIFQEKAQCVTLDIFLQNEVLFSVLRNLQGLGKVFTGVMQQLSVDLRISGELAQNEALSCGG